MSWIKDLSEGGIFRGPLLVVNISRGVTTGRQNFINITLQDKTGTIEGKMWDATLDDVPFLEIGKIVHLNATVTTFRENLQLRINQINETHEDEYDPNNFASSSPIPLDDLKARLDKYLKSIKNKDISLLTNYLIKKYYDKMVVYPAAVRVHHEFVSGLIHHTVTMCDVMEALLKVYVDLDRDLLLAGILLHDLGKTIELSSPIVPRYTIEGNLIGHISIMHAEIQKAAEKLEIKSEVPMLLSHMVLSHHGKYEFGSPVLPMLKEALVLNFIDNLDAKLTALDKALETTLEGEFTNRLFALDETAFYKIKKDDEE